MQTKSDVLLATYYYLPEKQLELQMFSLESL